MNHEEASKKKEKAIGVIAGMIAFAVTSYGVQQLFKKDLASELRSAAQELNKQGPLPVEQFTRLDSASANGKTNFIYYYTLGDLDKSEVSLESVNSYIRPNVIENVKKSPDLKYFRENSAEMDYRYYDRSGAFVIEIAVTSDLYQKE